MEIKTANPWFKGQLKTALVSLYDPPVLRASPLTELLDASRQQDPVSFLRRTLTDAIESLRPGQSIPPGSRTWRAYQVLRRRYIEGLSQRQVAADLGLSVRQLQREEKMAREMLADHMWVLHDLEGKAPDLAVAAEAEEDQEPVDDAREPSLEQELQWLSSSVPVQMTGIPELIQDVLDTVEPLVALPETLVTCVPPVDAPHVPLRAPIVRQVLLDIVTTAVRCVSHGRLAIEAQIAPQRVWIRVTIQGRPGQPTTAMAECTESLQMAEQLVRLCEGSLQVTTGPGKTASGGAIFCATIELAVAEHIPVLVVDDNVDALRLFQRYLTGTRYLFVGAQEARQGLRLAAEVSPRIIVLDVMMPEKDGWALLGQLREDPKLGHVPVIICTILLQKELALTLGAAAFIRKPVNRTDLLATLDRLAVRSPAGAC